MGTNMLRGGWLVATLALSGCTGGNPRVGLMTCRQYARSLASGPSNPRDQQTGQASHGNPAAIHACFARTVARLQRPFVLAGEDIMELNAEMEFLFYSLGDRRFAQALMRESTSTRSAVREFLGHTHLEGTAERTQMVFAATPQIDFRADRVTRKEFEHS